MTDAFSKASHGSPLGGLKAQPAWHPTSLACGDPAASAIPTTTSCVGGPTTFEQLKPLFAQMSPSELKKTADWLVPDASETAIRCRMWDIKNGTEQHM